MLIPSIDLMGGKIVQLVQGSRKALEFDDFQEWVDRFANYPLVQLIGSKMELQREIIAMGFDFKVIQIAPQTGVILPVATTK